MKFKWKYIGYFIVIILSAFLLKSCQTLSSYCSYKHKIEKIRDLPEERLTKLYKDMKTLYESDIDQFTLYRLDSEEGLPQQFTDLDVSFIWPKKALIVIGGCVDDKAFLNFRGYDSLKDIYSNPEIYMHWGDICADCNEIIWQVDD